MIVSIGLPLVRILSYPAEYPIRTFALIFLGVWLWYGVLWIFYLLVKWIFKALWE